MGVLRILVMVVAVVVSTSVSSAIPQSEEHKSRVIDHVSIQYNTMRVFSAPLYRKADREALQQS